VGSSGASIDVVPTVPVVPVGPVGPGVPGVVVTTGTVAIGGIACVAAVLFTVEAGLGAIVTSAGRPRGGVVDVSGWDVAATEALVAEVAVVRVEVEVEVAEAASGSGLPPDVAADVTDVAGDVPGATEVESTLTSDVGVVAISPGSTSVVGAVVAEVAVRGGAGSLPLAGVAGRVVSAPAPMPGISRRWGDGHQSYERDTSETQNGPPGHGKHPRRSHEAPSPQNERCP
jgi:hypothetical protein